MQNDTSPEIRKKQIEMYQAAPTWRRAQLWQEMINTSRQLMYLGLKKRYPQATESWLKRKMADMLLGETLAMQVYGPMLEVESE